MTAFKIGFILGYIISVILIAFKVFRKTRKTEEVDDVEKILIEYYEGSYLAYSEENQFVGQSTVLEELAMRLLGEILHNIQQVS